MLEREIAYIRRATTFETVPLIPEVTFATAHIGTLWRGIEKEFGSMGPWPYWAVPWPGGQALTRYILDNPLSVRGLHVVDCGCGSGIASIAAAVSGAVSVTATDIDPVAVAAVMINAEQNNVQIDCVREDAFKAICREADVLLMGDVFWEKELNPVVRIWVDTVKTQNTKALFGGDKYWPYPLQGITKVAEYPISKIKDIHTATEAIVYEVS